MIPNIIYGIKNPGDFENYAKSKTLILFEQIGRYGCFILMIFNIPFTYFGPWFDNDLSIYIIINSILTLIYLIGWVICWNKRKLLRAYLLSIVPSIIFVFSGIVYLNIPLLTLSVIFAITHITISLINAYHK